MPVAGLSASLHDLAGRSAAFDGVVRFAAQYLLYASLLVALVLWQRRDGLRTGLATIAGALLALVVGGIVGTLWDRPRPFVAGHYYPLFAHPADASFPSDHLMALGALAGAALMAWWPAAVVTTAFAVLVGAGRVIAGVHYVSDVVGGFVIGVAAACLAWRALAPLLPQLAQVDEALQRLHLRPSATGPSRDPG
jgi:undecaprenyl-diphosphatase